MYGVRLEHPSEVEDGTAAALAHDGPAVIDAVVNRTGLVVPPSVTMEMAKGSLYALKPIMNDRTDEVIDLARTNLWRSINENPVARIAGGIFSMPIDIRTC